MSTTFKEAKTAIKNSLDTITSPYQLTFNAKPPPGDPKLITQWPAAFLMSGSEDAEHGDLIKYQTTQTLGHLDLVVYVDHKGDENPDDDLNDVAQAIKNKIAALTLTKPDFTVRVRSVRYAYNLEHYWGAVLCSLEVGAFDWFE
jgi:hypothetical protein